MIAATLGVGGVALLFLPELDQATRGGSASYGVARFALGATVIACGGNLIAMRNHKAGIPTLSGHGVGHGLRRASAPRLPPSSEACRGHSIRRRVSACRWRYLVGLRQRHRLRRVPHAAQARVGGGPAAFVGVATPVIALALSTLFEGYRWTWVAALGVVLAVAGTLAGAAKSRRRAVKCNAGVRIAQKPLRSPYARRPVRHW